MKESIKIDNFGGIKSGALSLAGINVFIGKQASGKSVAAKLIFFFREQIEASLRDMAEGSSNREIITRMNLQFQRYFPESAWPSGTFSIVYSNRGKLDAQCFGHDVSFTSYTLTVERKGRTDIKVKAEPLLRQLRALFNIADEGRKQRPMSPTAKYADKDRGVLEILAAFGAHKVFGNQFFIPAGRSFFANISGSIFGLMAEGKKIDPFLVEFGAIYENLKSEESLRKKGTAQRSLKKNMAALTGAEFLSDKTDDYLLHTDGRKIPVLFCSSGQQEVLPLALALSGLAIRFPTIAAGFTYYIEEPEAHLFPTAQKTIVEMIARTFNSTSPKSQMVITTHSPYVLTSFNNLLEAGDLARNGVADSKIKQIVPKEIRIAPGELQAWEFAEGEIRELVAKDTGLIEAKSIDRVSGLIADEFERLLDLEV